MNTDEIKAEKDISMALEEDKEAFRVDCIKEETYDFEDGYREIKKEIKEEVNVQDYENEYEEGYEDIRTEENEKSIEITIKIEKEEVLEHAVLLREPIHLDVQGIQKKRKSTNSKTSLLKKKSKVQDAEHSEKIVSEQRFMATLIPEISINVVNTPNTEPMENFIEGYEEESLIYIENLNGNDADNVNDGLSNQCQKQNSIEPKKKLNKLIGTTRTLKKNITCYICTRKLTSNYHLNSHLRTHFGKKQYFCDMCGSSHLRKCDLIKHIRRKHIKEEFSCDFCSLKFPTKEYLNNHLHRHTGVRPFQCNMCEQKFTQRIHLNKHIKAIHISKKDYVCQMCKLDFLTKSCLKKHLHTHDLKKKFVCDLCDCRYSRLGYLEKHKMSVHTMGNVHDVINDGHELDINGFVNIEKCESNNLIKNVKKKKAIFLCHLCPYKFPKRNTLNRHLLTHSGEKPFSCDFCGYRCSRNYLLQRHINSIHAN